MEIILCAPAARLISNKQSHKHLPKPWFWYASATTSAHSTAFTPLCMLHLSNAYHFLPAITFASRNSNERQLAIVGKA